MRKILLIMLGCVTLMSCTPPKKKIVSLAKERLELIVDDPKQIKVFCISEPDSAFGTGYFTETETREMMQIMKAVTDTIMKRTANMTRFEPDDRYVVSLAERQMRGMAEISSMIMKSKKKGDFCGWKVKIDYSCVDANAIPYRAERWFFIDKDVKQVYQTFELPIP